MEEESFVTLEGEETDESRSEREPEPNLGGTRRKSMCFVEIQTNGKTQSVILNINRDITEAAERLKRDSEPVRVHQSMRKALSVRGTSTPPPATAISGLPDVIESDEEDECPICMDVIDLPQSLTTSCMHNFHQTCLLSFLQYKNLYQCPFCKQSITEVTPYNSNPLSKDTLLEMLYNSASDVRFDYDAAKPISVDSSGGAKASFFLQLYDTLGKPSIIESSYRVEAVASCSAPGVVLKNFVSEGGPGGVVTFDDLCIQLPVGYNLESGLFLSVAISCEHESDELELLCDGKTVDVELDFEEPPPPPASQPKQRSTSQTGTQTLASMPPVASDNGVVIVTEADGGGVEVRPTKVSGVPTKKSIPPPRRKVAPKDTACSCVVA